MATYRGEETLASSQEMSTTHQFLSGESVSISSAAALLDKRIAEGASPRAVRAEKVGSFQVPPLCFDSKSVPEISIYDYLERLRRYAHFDSSVVVALIYIDRILENDPTFAVTYVNVHRLILTCTTVAEKYINDIPYINTFYATVGGVHLKDLNRLEITLLNALMWRLDVSPEEFDRKQEDMRRALADEFSASDATSWILLSEAVIEIKTEAVYQKERSDSDSAMQASTTAGSTFSGDSEDVSDSSEESIEVASDVESLSS
jgi:hypothetical protein